MKKLIIGLISAMLMASGLVAASAGSASAACPYTGCVQTYNRLHVPKNVLKHHRARICVLVTTGGNGQPRGHVTIRVNRRAGGYHFVDTKRYRQHRTCFTTGHLHKRGKYIVKSVFDRRPGSAFRDSDNHKAFRVVRHR